ncbi:iron-containing alcohol dehydrogenase [Aminipila sp.]|uniref:iron-containing alcohol dehydrogenase n=1 Tax=Aminipila sp. TaxID=2060095 RepID=UPI0028A0ACE5|nr:iron-containing alcohol dehydrogenase [Aminipila sp.]
MITNFRNNANLIFGLKSAERIGKETAKYGKRIFIVTGKASTKKSGLLDRVIHQLQEEKLQYVLFDRIEKNPVVSKIMEGAQIAEAEKCDAVLALGGGSIMDAAKGIAFFTKNQGEFETHQQGMIEEIPALPLILVPTTCGTGSEVNRIAVFTKDETLDKRGMRKNGFLAKTSIVDPELMMTMPKFVLASVGFDALCHLIEAYISSRANVMSDIFAEKGIKLLKENLVRLYKDYGNVEAWEAVALASTLGGYTLDTAGACAPHAFEHPLSGYKNIVHGEGLAAVMPAIIRASVSGNPQRFAELSRMLGGNNEQDCAEAIENLLKGINLKITLSDLGFVEKDILWLSDNVFKVASGNINVSPVVFDRLAVERIYRESL